MDIALPFLPDNLLVLSYLVGWVYTLYRSMWAVAIADMERSYRERKKQAYWSYGNMRANKLPEPVQPSTWNFAVGSMAGFCIAFIWPLIAIVKFGAIRPPKAHQAELRERRIKQLEREVKELEGK